MSGKVVLITGTSSGVGQALAVQAAKAGYQVVATMRDTSKNTELTDLDVRSLDITDDESVRTCLTGVLDDYGKLDALVNNAGAGHVGTLEMYSMDTFRRIIETNLVGTVRMTKAALPHLRATKGRLVTVTSVGGAIGHPFNEAYCAAKFGVEGLLEGMAPVVRELGVHVSVVEPGAIASKFVENAVADRAELLASAGVYRELLERYAQRTDGAFESAQTPEEVAEVVLRVLGEPEPKFRYQTSPAVEQFAGAKLKDLDGSAIQALTSTWVAP